MNCKTSQALQGFSFLSVFSVTTWLESLVFRLELAKSFKNGRLFLLEREHFACWFRTQLLSTENGKHHKNTPLAFFIKRKQI